MVSVKDKKQVLIYSYKDSIIHLLKKYSITKFVLRISHFQNGSG